MNEQEEEMIGYVKEFLRVNSIDPDKAAHTTIPFLLGVLKGMQVANLMWINKMSILEINRDMTLLSKYITMRQARVKEFVSKKIP